MASNPIRAYYDAVWTMLEANTDFVTLFPHNTIHQLRYNPSTSLQNYYTVEPDLEELAPADFPLSRITIKNGDPATERVSNGSWLIINYQIEVCTGNLQQGLMADIIWAIYRACLKWRTYLQNVSWNGDNPVADVDIKQIKAKENDEERNRGTRQWIALFDVEVTFCFNTTTIKAL